MRRRFSLPTQRQWMPSTSSSWLFEDPSRWIRVRGVHLDSTNELFRELNLLFVGRIHPQLLGNWGKYSSLDSSWRCVSVENHDQIKIHAYHSHFNSQAQISTTSSDWYNDTWLKTERKHPKSIKKLCWTSSTLPETKNFASEKRGPWSPADSPTHWHLLTASILRPGKKRESFFLPPNKKPSP